MSTMSTKAQLEERIVELTRICDKETDRADALQSELIKARELLKQAKATCHPKMSDKIEEFLQ